MIRREVKSVTVEYEDGDVETFQETTMRHISRQEYPRGATKTDECFTTHEIRWISSEE